MYILDYVLDYRTSIHCDHCNHFLGSQTGQFYRNGVEIDEVQRILLLPGRNPVSLRQRPVWGFMKQEKVEGKHCWAALNRGEQGEGLIDGNYMDYKVKDLLSMDFKFTQ